MNGRNHHRRGPSRSGGAERRTTTRTLWGPLLVQNAVAALALDGLAWPQEHVLATLCVSKAAR